MGGGGGARGVYVAHSLYYVISPNVFGDIMVLASPPPSPRLPVDTDDVNAITRKILNGSLSNFI